MKLSMLRSAAQRARSRSSSVPVEDDFFFDDVQPGDTYLVSFPRSGNTFLRYLVASLLLDRQPSADDVAAVVPDVHRASSRRRPSVSGSLVAKSHAPVRDVPANVVYLVRDGRAALLSYHSYLQQRGRPTPSSADAMLAWDDVWPCPWAEHVRGWLDHLSRRERNLVLRYEDLVDDPARALRNVAELAGIAWNAAAVDRAVQRSSAEAMRAAEQTAAAGSLNFVGPGSSGWPGAFSADALLRFESSCGPLLVQLGYPLVSSAHE